MFSGYVGIYRRKKYVGGRPRGPRDRGKLCFMVLLDVFGVCRYIYRRKKYVGGRPRGPQVRGRTLQGAASSYLVGASAAS